ncbi:MAG: flotillin family protein [Eubacteriales bacterium]|nr:flotillin family protein [Eubacteriales bacterium]
MGWIIPAVVAVFVIAICLSGYVKAPPDQAYIISGLRRRVIVGKAGIKIPLLERLDKLSLVMISVDVKTGSFVPTAEYINVMVDGAVKIKIGDSVEMLELAAQNFLNRTPEYIISQVQDVLEGNMREIVGQMNLRDMVTNRKLFAEKVQENAVPDLNKMGLEIVSFNVQNFTDKEGIIADLGIDNISQIKKEAAIAKAEAERDVAIAEAEAKQKANEAKVAADTRIAEQNNDLRIRSAELVTQSDIKQAEADAAYKIQEQQQRKVIETTSVEADIAKREQESLLMEKEIALTERRLEAEVKKTAEAQKYAAQQKADADLYAREQEAEARRIEREKEAEGIRLVGAAEAESIRLKAVAEAEGIDRKAEAMKKYGEAAVMDMYFKVLPEVAKAIAEPLAKVDKITMYGDGNSEKLVKEMVNTTSRVTDGLLEGVGLDIKKIIGDIVNRSSSENPDSEEDKDSSGPQAK